jgi:hypothetical protein
VLFTKNVLERLAANLQQLGLATCPVCGGAALNTDRRPVVMTVGGGDRLRDSTTNIAYHLRILCDMCGHVMLFDVERYVSGDEPIFETG